MPRKQILPYETFIRDLKCDISLLKKAPSNGGFINILISQLMPLPRTRHFTKYIVLDWEKMQQSNCHSIITAINELERLFVLIWITAKDRKDNELTKRLCKLVGDISLGQHFYKGDPLCRCIVALRNCM